MQYAILGELQDTRRLADGQLGAEFENIWQCVQDRWAWEVHVAVGRTISPCEGGNLVVRRDLYHCAVCPIAVEEDYCWGPGRASLMDKYRFFFQRLYLRWITLAVISQA
jgi:hypothetical protein